MAAGALTPFLAGVSAAIAASGGDGDEPLIGGPAVSYLCLSLRGIVSSPALRPRARTVGAALAVYFRLLARSSGELEEGNAGRELVDLLRQVADHVRDANADLLRGLREHDGAAALAAAVAALPAPAAAMLRGLRV